VEGDVVAPGNPQAEASSPSAALLAPLRTARRSRLEQRNQLEPPTNTPFTSSREAQSSGAQCEGGLAADKGLVIAFDIVSLLQGAPLGLDAGHAMYSTQTMLQSPLPPRLFQYV
jgi:hypothetical protein